ncbi:MAG: alanine dehydrogenase [Betaproteobacteria bacterium]|nr:alanine dehydrogenase [Betaproteobacteria bacterium]
MQIGVPKEVKNHEYRVGLTPAGAAHLIACGHQVKVQTGAGAAIGFDDDAYQASGATVVASATDAYSAELVVKVKEPQREELPLIDAASTLFCYLHLAADADLTKALLATGATCIAYETVTTAGGELPLLVPMSQVAGRLAIQVGAAALTLASGGRGVLLPGVPGVPPANVVILGGGTVGANAARIAVGVGADVTLLDNSPPRLRHLDDVFGARLKTVHATPHAVAESVRSADLVVGAVLLPAKRAPRLLSRAVVCTMIRGAALVDVSIDQGGISDTSRPTTHSDPTYIEEGVVHYCVTNMPAATARTSTLALTEVTLPYVEALASNGIAAATRADPGLRDGLNLHAGRVTCRPLAEDLDLPWTPPDDLGF